jgi:hypothetical protein
VIQNALDDREVDIILAIGSLVTHEAAKDDLRLTKPFVSAFVQRADLPKLPIGKDGSLKENFSLVVIPQRAERDIRMFQEMTSFKRLHVGVASEELQYISDLQTGLSQYEDSLGINIVLVPITTNVAASLQNLDGGAEAFYLTRLPRLTVEDRKELLSVLSDRGIPTFSLLGHPDVELGALAGITPEIIPLVVRRVALNISQIIRGVNTVDLPAALSVDSKLLINGQTAAAIGYSPALDMLVYANFLHAGALRPESKGLSFTQAMKDAEKGNTSLTISDAGVEISRREKQLSRSVLLPQVGSYISYQKSDDRGGASSLLVPEDLTVAGIRASQMIYDDFAISNFRSSSRLYDGELQAREADRLDVLADAGQNYLLYALAIILNRIEAANVHLTEDNLEVSKLRLDVGYSGRDEVYRWQAELAQRRSGLFDSYAEIEASRIALNQVLGIEQSLRWEPEEVSPDAASTYFLGGRLNELWNNVARLRKLHDFAVEFAYENSPELKFLEQAISAQGIQVGQRNRRFVLPSFSANFSYDFQLNRSKGLRGNGSW